MQEEEKVKVPVWAIGIIMTLIGAIFVGAIAWGTARADIDSIKGSLDDAKRAESLVIKHDAIIPQLQDDVRSIKTAQETFRQEYRQDQQMLGTRLQEILKAVKA